MNTISLSAGNIIISLDDTEIDIGGTVYKNLVVIARLLNIFDTFLINAAFDIRVARNLDYDGMPY